MSQIRTDNLVICIALLLPLRYYDDHVNMRLYLRLRVDVDMNVCVCVCVCVCMCVCEVWRK